MFRTWRLGFKVWWIRGLGFDVCGFKFHSLPYALSPKPSTTQCGIRFFALITKTLALAKHRLLLLVCKLCVCVYVCAFLTLSVLLCVCIWCSTAVVFIIRVALWLAGWRVRRRRGVMTTIGFWEALGHCRTVWRLFLSMRTLTCFWCRTQLYNDIMNYCVIPPTPVPARQSRPSCRRDGGCSVLSFGLPVKRRSHMIFLSAHSGICEDLIGAGVWFFISALWLLAQPYATRQESDWGDESRSISGDPWEATYALRHRAAGPARDWLL